MTDRQATILGCIATVTILAIAVCSWVFILKHTWHG